MGPGQDEVKDRRTVRRTAARKPESMHAGRVSSAETGESGVRESEMIKVFTFRRELPQTSQRRGEAEGHRHRPHAHTAAPHTAHERTERGRQTRDRQIG